MKLAYQKWGIHPDAPKCIFLHGLGGTSALWKPLAIDLEKDLQILALDQRGHGRSQISNLDQSSLQVSYTPLDYGKDVVETMGSLQFYPAWFLAHSMGVRTAAAVGHLKKEWIQGLILLDLGFSEASERKVGKQLALFLRSLPKEFVSREEAKKFMRTHCPRPDVARYLIAISLESSTGKLFFPFDHTAVVRTLESTYEISIRKWIEELGAEKIPIYALRGRESQVWEREDFQEEKVYFASYPSVHFLEIPYAGHGLPFEQRSELTKLIKKWVLKLPSGNTPTQENS